MMTLRHSLRPLTTLFGRALGQVPPHLALLGLLATVACGVDPPADEDTAAVEDATDEDSGAGIDGGGTTDASPVDDAKDGVATDGSDVADATADVAADTSGGSDAEPSEVEADSTDSDAGETTTATDADAGPPAKKLPLPDCAKNCSECAKCADTTMCVSGKTYNNDCEAICALQAFEWPTGYEPSQGKCPDCAKCKPDEPVEQWCGTLKNGAKVTFNAKCETECADLATDVGTNPTKGPCKSACSKAPPSGGGCSNVDWQPVCAKQDGNTYQTKCAMDFCDLQGCFPIGKTAASAQCVPGKMTVECPGECYDSAKAGSCPNECKPVCAMAKSGKGQSYRNGCIANAEQAKVLSCEGISATSNDKCSAELYTAYGKGCCPDVDYASVKQVCASKGEGADALWMTFRNQSEFDCLVGAEKALWTFQFQGPCLCNCPQTEKFVCGDDGNTYQNACQAKCYNGDKFSWKEGPCSPK